MRKKFLASVSSTLIIAMMLAGCSNGSDNKSKEVTGEEINTEETSVTETNKLTGTIEYSFADSVKDKAGYAEGKITLDVKDNFTGSYEVYWGNDEGVLSGYYPIFTVEAKGTDTRGEVEIGKDVAIPADANKVIAVKADAAKEYKIADAIAVYDIAAEKQMHKSADALYTFNSISDVHIDEEKWSEAPAYWWEYSEAHWAGMLDYAVEKKVDFIVSSGDQVTNASINTLDKEWKAYQYILAQSDYTNPIYECGGNHEVRQDGVVADELAAYVKGSGLDGNMSTIASNKSYYYITEPKTGDMFIFMSLEGGYRPAQYDEFTTEQLDWLEGILTENYGKGKNIYIIQHAFIKGYGVGDDLEKPYYSGPGNPTLETSKRFISLIEKYNENVVWISGHSHLAFEYNYNYSNNDGKSCNMIHNSSVGNPTHITNNEIDYAFNENLSEGYYVETYADNIVFYGANLVDKKIYPMYSYIMPGKTSALSEGNPEKREYVAGSTAGNVRSIIANANTVLGIYYEYSSYDQYQALKKLYYEYKDKLDEIDNLDEKELCYVYGSFKNKIEKLASVVRQVEKLELTVETTEK